MFWFSSGSIYEFCVSLILVRWLWDVGIVFCIVGFGGFFIFFGRDTMKETFCWVGKVIGGLGDEDHLVQIGSRGFLSFSYFYFLIINKGFHSLYLFIYFSLS